MRDYSTFLKLRTLPTYSWSGTTAVVPDEYASYLDESPPVPPDVDYVAHPRLFDYQRDIATMAIRKRKFAIFADCGLGKTLMLLEFARHVSRHDPAGRVLIVSPLMVVRQTVAESQKFYGGDITLQPIAASELPAWMRSGTGIGITNYESIRDDLPDGSLSGLILDESSMLKSHYGKWGTRLIALGRGVTFKLACTGTPAPNDRIEYANHAVFLDCCRTTNEFLATYFVNRGKTQNRWEIKPHALRPFYRDLSHWCVFLSDPSVYGWNDNTDTIPPIHVHIDYVPMTAEQRAACQQLTGSLLVKEAGGIGQRGKLSQIAKGHWNGEPIHTRKPEFIRNLIESWPGESTIVWCHFNAEQDIMESTFPEAHSIRGETTYESRLQQLDDFLSGRVKILISKPSVLGFGLNLQIATRQVFNGMRDSYEEFYQAVKRSNRIGSTRPLHVHIPVTEIEEPMVSSVLTKADRVESDTAEQESLFREMMLQRNRD